MDRYPFDPVAFVLGTLAVTAGVIVLGGGELLEEARLLIPLGLVALGIAVLVRLAGER